MSSPESGITRRDFLKRTCLAAAGVAMGTLGINELLKGTEGIVRANGCNFIPLHERHDKGLGPERIPVSLDAIFREAGDDLNTIKEFFDSDYSRSEENVRNALVMESSETDVGKILGDLSRQNAPLVFGDIVVRDSDLKRYLVISHVEIAVGVFSLLAMRQLSEDEIPENYTWRKILQIGLGAAAIYGLSNGFKKIIGSYLSQQKNMERGKRIDGLISHTSPYDVIIFFRNAVMANKLLLTGEYLKEKLGRRPNIAFWVGGGHSGIEDFLQAGQGVCRRAIALYPQSFLQRVADDSGGAEDFSSALLVYPHSKGDGQYSYETVKITDRQLQKAIS